MWSPDGAALVGRATELESARAQLEAALAGAGGLLVVTGDAGIGKTAFVAALVASLPHGAVRGRAVPGSTVALRALSHAARDAVARGADSTDASLSIHRRAVGQLLGEPQPRAHDPARVDELEPHPLATADALLQLVQLSRTGALVLEDLHWADPDTLDSVSFLADQVAGRRVLVVAVARTGESRDCDLAVSALDGRPRVQRIALGSLAEPDAWTVARRAAAPDAPHEVLRGLVSAARGNPLALEQLAAAGGVPDGLATSVTSRLARLDARQRAALEAGAVLGADFDPETVATCVRQDPPDVASALATGVDRRLLTWDGMRAGFVHALVHDAVLASVPPPRRAELADRASAASDPHDHELQARLSRLAGRPHAAARHLLAVASDSLVRNAFHSALVNAAAAVAEDPDPDVTLRASEIELTAHALAGQVDLTVAAAQRLDVLLDPDDHETRGRVHLALVRALVQADRWEDAHRRLQLVAKPWSAAVCVLAASVSLGLGEPTEAERLARQGLAVAAEDAEASGHGIAAVRCEAYEVLGRLARLRDLDEAEVWFRRAASSAFAAGLVLWRARAEHELATLIQLRTVETAPLEDARRLAVEASAPGLVTRIDFHLAAVHGVRFDAEESLQASARVVEAARRLGAAGLESWGWILIGQAQVAGGRFDEAGRAADRARDLRPEDPEIEALAEGTCRGLADVLKGDRESALRRFTLAADRLRPLTRSPLPPWYLWPLVAAAWGDPDDAARALADDHPALRVLPGVRGLWLLAGAVGTARRGESPSAELEDAQRCFDGLSGFEAYRVLGRRLAAEAALADGWDPGWADVAGWLTEAHDWAETHRQPAVAAQCQALLRRAGAPRRRRGRGASEVPPDLARLGVTSRELDVWRLIAAGRTNPAIAQELYVAVRTVKTHVESLLRKTGCTNRVELAARLSVRG